MTKKEFIAIMKRHQSTIDVLQTEIEKAKKEFLTEQLKAMDLKEGDVIEVLEATRSFYDIGGKVKQEWIRGFISRPRVEEDDGTITISLGTVKKDGTPSAIGTRLYFVHITGRNAQTIRKIVK